MKIQPIATVLAAALSAVALYFASPAHAQAPATKPSAAPANTPATAPPGHAAAQIAETLRTPVTPEAHAAIKDLLEVTHVPESLKKTYQAMGQSLPPQMAQAMNHQIEQNVSLSAEQKQQVRERMNKSFEGVVKDAAIIMQDQKMFDETIEKLYPIYAKYYTPAEIKQITAFYKTPIGAKVIATMPQVFNDSLLVGFSVFQPRLNVLMDHALKQEVDAVQKAPAPKK